MGRDGQQMNERHITDKQLDTLRHTLGYNYSPRHVRNAFVTGPGSDDFADCMALVELGLMENRGDSSLLRGRCFAATEAGHALVRSKEPPPKKYARSQKRYQEWLRADLGISFREWLGIKPKDRYARP